MSKRVIIVRHNCHEFANKLWSDMAIYAYALTVKASVWDIARFEVGALALFHKMAARLIGRATASAQYVILPPTAPLEGKFADRNTSYFFGWLYRNPKGFSLYRKELLERFGPTAHEEARLKKILTELPSDRTIIGVCVRLKPFPYFTDGEFLVPPERVRDIVTEYLYKRELTLDQVTLVLIADKPILRTFKNFRVYTAGRDERLNFFLLSKCSAIIGTNTTYCNLAAWFGAIPHIVTTMNPVDWVYYQGRDSYFENKYATFALGVPGQC